MDNDPITDIAAEIVRLKARLWAEGKFKGENPVNKLDFYPVKPPAPKPMPPPVAPTPAPAPPVRDRARAARIAWEAQPGVKEKIALRNKLWYSRGAMEINRKRRAKYNAENQPVIRRRTP